MSNYASKKSMHALSVPVNYLQFANFGRGVEESRMISYNCMHFEIHNYIIIIIITTSTINH